MASPLPHPSSLVHQNPPLPPSLSPHLCIHLPVDPFMLSLLYLAVYSFSFPYLQRLLIPFFLLCRFYPILPTLTPLMHSIHLHFECLFFYHPRPFVILFPRTFFVSHRCSSSFSACQLLPLPPWHRLMALKQQQKNTNPRVKCATVFWISMPEQALSLPSLNCHLKPKHIKGSLNVPFELVCIGGGALMAHNSWILKNLHAHVSLLKQACKYKQTQLHKDTSVNTEDMKIDIKWASDGWLWKAVKGAALRWQHSDYHEQHTTLYCYLFCSVFCIKSTRWNMWKK